LYHLMLLVFLGLDLVVNFGWLEIVLVRNIDMESKDEKSRNQE